MAVIQPTITEQISNMKARDISYRALHSNLTVIDDNNISDENIIEIPFESYVDKYRDYLSKIVQNVLLSELDKVRYRYNPKKVSEVFYNTTEYWYLILKLNECVSVSDFGEMTIMKIYDPAQIKSYINEIMYIEGLA